MKMGGRVMALAVAALLAASVFPAAEGKLRTRSVAGETPEFDLDAKKKEIKTRWDKLDKFLKVMFQMACEWKHTQDVDGPVAELIKDDDIKPSEMPDAKADIQDKNVVHLKRACGMIVAGGKKECRQSAADRWGPDMERRAKADQSCVDAYGNFESMCLAKAGNLEQVYDMSQQTAAAKKQCYEGHCEKFPTVWMKSGADGMKSEVDGRCDSYCSEKNVKMRCGQKWALEVDFVIGSIESECAESAGAAECFKKGKKTASDDHDTCKSDGESECGTQKDKCKSDGNTDSATREAGQFCKDRHDMCKEQVTKNCQADHQKALDDEKKACEKEAGSEFKDCKAKALKTKEEKAMADCVKDRTPKCDKECHGKCKVGKMRTCLDNLKTEDDPTEMFCVDFWNLLHKSSEVDPETGRPIVLLRNSSLVAPNKTSPARRA